jgi:uncharacterized protein involved in outer membrane biogenesis
MENANDLRSVPDSPPKGSRRVLRFLKRLFITLIILIIVIVGGGALIGYFYQDEVKQYVISQLNKRLTTDVIVDGKNIDFTVIKNFPMASVDFKNVTALDAGLMKKKDTLFKAGEISLQFNIIDIFKKNYRVKNIEVHNAKIRLRTDKEGNDNYHFWKESADSTSEEFSFELEKILLSDVKISYVDRQRKELLEAKIHQAKLKGNFSTKKYILDSEASFFVDHFRSDSISYLKNKSMNAQLSLEVDNSTSSIKISEGRIGIEDLVFEAYGNVVTAGGTPLVNLGVKGKDMDIQSVLSLIPAVYKGKIRDYESEGEFYFSATIQGPISSREDPAISADFGMKNASITQVREEITLRNVNLSGHYSNGDPEKSQASVFSLSKFSATVNEGSVSGDIIFRNLSNPSFSGNINVNTNLADIQSFVKIDTIESLKGKIKMNASFSFDGKKQDVVSYENVSTSGDLLITDAAVVIKKNPMSFEKINGDFKFDNNDLIINDFTGIISGSDFELKGFFRNIMGYILKEGQDITVEATLKSDKIDLNELLSDKDDDSNGKYNLRFSEHVNVNLSTDIKQIVFRKFNAANITGVVKLKDKKLFLDALNLTTMGGRISTSGIVDGRDSSKLIVTCFSEVNRINITQMFAQCENFGQTTITDKNIRGVSTAKIQFVAELGPDLKMVMPSLQCALDMTIENGELNNVESFKSLSRFIELKELENIKFATLKNQIEIRNEVIRIPKMEVKSNAINITAAGEHTFNNEINYKVKLSLNELLSKKAKKAKKENDEFGEVADDGLGRTNIFLSMTGTVENPVIKYDSKSAMQNVKEDIKVEKQNLKGIFKEEFGLFKNDSTLKTGNNVKKEDQAKFKINWEEENKKEEKKELKKPKKPEEDDF